MREGAGTTAAQQIDKVIGLLANRSTAFNALLASLEDGYPFHPAFLDSLMKWYGAGVYQTTFPDEGEAAVNAYVDKQTHGLIPKLITNEFTVDTVMSLVNTLYLNARWQRPFNKNLTGTGQFTTTKELVSTKMMLLDETDTDYAAGPGWQAVRLPYRGNRLSMEILVPAKGHSPVGLLDPQVLAQAAGGFTPS